VCEIKLNKISRTMANNEQNIFLVNLVVLTLIYCVYASLSGIYVDDGHQSVLHHQLSRDETYEVEHEILELLGLPDRPRKRHIHPSLR
jgi:bone morphogenetic protein 7